MKICKECGKEKELTEFRKKEKRIRNICKKCNSIKEKNNRLKRERETISKLTHEQKDILFKELYKRHYSILRLSELFEILEIEVIKKLKILNIFGKRVCTECGHWKFEEELKNKLR